MTEPAGLPKTMSQYRPPSFVRSFWHCQATQVRVYAYSGACNLLGKPPVCSQRLMRGSGPVNACPRKLIAHDIRNLGVWRLSDCDVPVRRPSIGAPRSSWHNTILTVRSFVIFRIMCCVPGAIGHRNRGNTCVMRPVGMFNIAVTV